MNNQNQPASSADKQPVVPQEQQPVQPQPKKPRPKWLVPVIVVVGVLVLGLIAWGAYELFKPAPAEEPVVEDEFANWKTYRNEEYGFEAKYPMNWHADDYMKDYVNITDYSPSTIAYGGKLGKEHIKITIIVYENPGKNVDEWISKISKPSPEKIRETTINNIKTIVTKDDIGIEPGNDFAISFRLIFANKGYDISYRPIDSNLSTTFNQILSTFKFLE